MHQLQRIPIGLGNYLLFIRLNVNASRCNVRSYCCSALADLEIHDAKQINNGNNVTTTVGVSSDVILTMQTTLIR